MTKVKIKVITLGHIPPILNLKAIKKYKSNLFSIYYEIEAFRIQGDSDGHDWEFSDVNIGSQLSAVGDGDYDFLIAIANVPLESNWYSRRLEGNKVVFTLHETKDILQHYNIPIENIIYRLFYAYTLCYKRNNGEIPDKLDPLQYTHDETRGCIFDMTGIKTDIIHSCHKPIICDDCVQGLRSDKVSENIIAKAKNEIKRIKKPLFFRISDFVKKHPIASLIIAILISTLSSILANFIYDFIN